MIIGDVLIVIILSNKEVSSVDEKKLEEKVEILNRLKSKVQKGQIWKIRIEARYKNTKGETAYLAIPLKMVSKSYQLKSIREINL